MGFMQIFSALTTTFLTFSTNHLRKGNVRRGKEREEKKNKSAKGKERTTCLLLGEKEHGHRVYHQRVLSAKPKLLISLPFLSFMTLVLQAFGKSSKRATSISSHENRKKTNSY